jgi:catechol 2,3-dioxygenase-like lactoylglutathione lyase family enzyme
MVRTGDDGGEAGSRPPSAPGHHVDNERKRQMGATLTVVGVVVEDMARSLAFYRRLGLDVPAGADTEPHVEVGLPGGLKLAFDTRETILSFDPSWAPSSGSPKVSLAFACDSPDEVDKLYGELVAAGYEGHKEPWDAFWGMRYAVLHDPDGNGVDLFCPTGA